MMENQKRIKAGIISRQTEKFREIVRNLSRETESLSADELGTLSIVIGLEAQIRGQEEQEQKARPKLRVL